MRFLLPILVLLAACAAQERQPQVVLSGTVVSAPTAEAWHATASAFRRMAGAAAELDGDQGRASMSWQGGLVRAELEPHTSGGTIIRIGATRAGKRDDELAHAALLQIQTVLLEWQGH